MHAAGGNVLFYKDLADLLGEDQPCYGMQAVGLSGHQSAYDRIEDMAAHYIREIKGVQPNGPYYVVGASLGGLIAYEVGSQLRKSGAKVPFVAMFDTFAPGYPIPLPGTTNLSRRIFGFADRVEHHINTFWILERGKRWPYIVAKSTKARTQFRRAYKQTKRKFARGVYKTLRRQLPEALVVTQLNISAAAKAYRPSPYGGDVILFRASKQFRGIYRDDTLGWSKLAMGQLEIHEVNGNHGAIVVEPRVRFPAAVLRDLLNGRKLITSTPVKD